MPDVFDAKYFNAEVFQQYMNRIENPNAAQLVKSKAIRQRPDLAAAMSEQTGGNIITTPMLGLISGSSAQNYDGKTDITTNSTVTFHQTRVVVGRQSGWTEKDFSYDITGGQDFMENVAAQLSEWAYELDQDTILCIMKGVFGMADAEGAKFVASHTHDITGVTNSEGKVGVFDATTMNTAMQRACGDKKSKFTMAIMHSIVSTGLENLKLLTYAKYNDANGLERDIQIATVNGRLVLIDDAMPVENGFFTAASGDAGALKVVATGAVAGTSVLLSDVTKSDFYPAGVAADAYVIPSERFTTYVFGDGAIELTDAGVKVPVEMARDPKTNGGQDTLYYRQRKAWAPNGISFTKKHMATASPTDEELSNHENWELVNGQDKDGKAVYISGKVIPIARILSRG